MSAETATAAASQQDDEGGPQQQPPQQQQPQPQPPQPQPQPQQQRGQRSMKEFLGSAERTPASRRCVTCDQSLFDCTCVDSAGDDTA